MSTYPRSWPAVHWRDHSLKHVFTKCRRCAQYLGDVKLSLYSFHRFMTQHRVICSTQKNNYVWYFRLVQILTSVLLWADQIKRICLASPDAFVCPRMWLSHSALIKNAIIADTIETATGVEPITDRATQKIQRLISDKLYDIQMRNEAMLFHNPPTKGVGRLARAVNDVKVCTNFFFVPSLRFWSIPLSYSTPSRQLLI